MEKEGEVCVGMNDRYAGLRGRGGGRVRGAIIIGN